MNVLVITCHPSERSFTRALASRAEEAASRYGASVVSRNLYEIHFDPVLTESELSRRTSLDPAVQQAVADIRAADLVVFLHPDWWSGPPALLKGWIDRVFRQGVAYDWAGAEFTLKHREPLLGGRSVMVFVPTHRAAAGNPGATSNPGAAGRPPADPPTPGDALNLFWSGVCSWAGLDLITVRVFPEVRTSGLRARRRWLDEVDKTITLHITSADGHGEATP